MAPFFVSLGMVVLDELRFPHEPAMRDVTGGSGAFSTLGARLVAGKERSREVGCVLMAGDDFPESKLAQFRSWGLDLVVVRKSGRQSTRGLLIYEDDVFGHKRFQYTTERLQPMPSDLTSSSLLGSSAFHLLASPDLAREQIQQLISLRQSNGVGTRPLFVWEPLPGSCESSLRQGHFAAAKLVDVYSPNHLEFMALFEAAEPMDGDQRVDRKLLESYVEVLLESGISSDGTGAVIVRAGRDGCLVSSTAISERHVWLPAFYEDDSAVVDATGAGNTFLGALAFAISACSHDIIKASAIASVAASFSLQQIGLPRLSSGSGSGSQERWNGDTFTERCTFYDAKMAVTRLDAHTPLVTRNVTRDL